MTGTPGKGRLRQVKVSLVLEVLQLNTVSKHNKTILYTPRNWEAEIRELKVQDQPWLVSLGLAWAAKATENKQKTQNQNNVLPTSKC